MPIDKIKIYALLAAHSYPKRRILDEDSQLRNKVFQSELCLSVARLISS